MNRTRVVKGKPHITRWCGMWIYINSHWPHIGGCIGYGETPVNAYNAMRKISRGLM